MDRVEHDRRLAALRSELAARELAVYIVPRADEHQHSYLPPASERLAWLTGFTGSWGTAVVGRERAALFVDGRYTLQARDEAPGWEQQHLITSPPDGWLRGMLQAGDRVGYDPRVHTPDGVRTLAAAAERAGAKLAPVDNLIDLLWTDRPTAPRAPVELYPDALAGATRGDKRRRIAGVLRTDRLDALVVSAPDNLAWLLNLRGRDLPMTPVVLGFAILRVGAEPDATVTVFVDGDKLGPEVRAALSEERTADASPAIAIAAPGELAAALAELRGLRVRVDQISGSEWSVQQLRAAGATPEVGADPCSLAKACKTAAELAAIRAAHERDGVALVRLLAWLDGLIGTPGLAGETEWTVALRAAALRAEGEHYRGPSFRTIAGAGPNGALPHYALHEATARPLAADDVLLVDSGGQYLDGTTDVTRTIVLGTPSAEVRRRYTQVLKGHLGLGSARFPDDTTGSQLDLLARQHLWADGVDYDHGTGHGVGCFLAVHEGPQGIAKRPNTVALRPGMILSNEPGYYKAGAYGIRIENLVVVEKLDPQPAGAELTMLGFETVTLAPYDRRLIDLALLTAGERATVDAYHARVRATLTPRLDAATAAFLAAATEPL